VRAASPSVCQPFGAVVLRMMMVITIVMMIFTARVSRRDKQTEPTESAMGAWLEARGPQWPPLFTYL
jgi:hypothetical protein